MLPTIIGIIPHTISIVGGTGSSGKLVANITANLSSGTFAGTFNPLGTSGDNAFFIITSGGALSIGASDITTYRTYNLTISPVQDSYPTNGPFAATVAVTAPGATQAFITNSANGSQNTGNYGNNTPAGMWFTVGSSNISVTAIGRWIISGNNQSHTLALYDAAVSTASDQHRDLAQVGSPVVLNASNGSNTTTGTIVPNAFNYVNLPVPVVLAAGRSYFLTSTESQGGGNDLLYNGGTYSTTSDGVLNGNAYYPAPGYYYGPWSWGGGGPFGPVNFIYQTTSALASVPGSSFYGLLGRMYNNAGGALFVLPNVIYAGHTVSGSSTVRIDGGFLNYGLIGNTSTLPGTYVLQYIIDENAPSPYTPIYSPYITGPAEYPGPNPGVIDPAHPVFPWLTDTLNMVDFNGTAHTLADGTHSISAVVIDSTSGVQYSEGYRTRNVRCSLLVQNTGPTNGAQLVPLTDAGNNARIYPYAPDWVHYDGNTRRTMNPYPYPASPTSSPPVYSMAPGNAWLSRTGGWYQMHLMGMRYIEYETDPTFCTTLSGGVFINQFHSTGSLTIGGAASPNLTTKYNWDGQRCDNRTDPLTTATAAPDGSGFVAVEYQGRVIHIDYTGNVTTLFGLRLSRDTTLSFENVTASGYSESQRLQPYEIVGTPSSAQWFGTWFGGWNDLCFDPTDTTGPGGTSQTIYIASAVNQTIIKVTGLFSATPQGFLFAGSPGIAGYTDNVAAASATFSSPMSVQCDSSGNLYIADHDNSAIRKYTKSTGIISTAFGNQTGKPTAAQYWAAQVQTTPLSNSYAGGIAGNSVSSSSAYINFPSAIRLNSTGDLIVFEDGTNLFRRIWLSGANAGTTTLIGWSATYAGPGEIWAQPFVGPGQPGFKLFDVDTAGAVGPVDDIFLVIPPEANTTATCGRMAIDGSYNGGFTSDGGGMAFPGFVGSTGDRYDTGLAEGTFTPGITPDAGAGVYSWLVGLSRTQSVIIFAGFRYTGIVAWRASQATDPGIGLVAGGYNPFDGGSNFYALGCTIWRWGSALCFPQGYRPGFHHLMGCQGLGHLGSDVGPSTQDICMMYNGGTAAYNTGSTVPIASITISAGSATVTLTGSNHAFVYQAGNFVMISGATASAGSPNGMFKVTTFTSNQNFVVSMPGVTGPITGTPVLQYGDAVMQAFMQRGACGAVPRPEITGRDWDALSFFIRRSCLLGSFPTVVSPNPAISTDFVPPQVTALSATRNSAHSITVNWTTDKSTIGMAVCGSAVPWTSSQQYKYCCWSPVEASFGTTHSATIAYTPSAQLLHYSVVVKDTPGNSSYGPDQTIAYP
jgi:hypothetical protein